MKYVLHILKKALSNERRWLAAEHLAAIDPKYKHGAAFARERIPQLEQAITLLSAQQPILVKGPVQPGPPNAAAGLHQGKDTNTGGARKTGLPVNRRTVNATSLTSLFASLK